LDCAPVAAPEPSGRLPAAEEATAISQGGAGPNGTVSEQSSRVLPPPPDSAADQLPARVKAMAEQLCRPHYQRLYAGR
jgi:hypothetical protein